MDKYEKLKIALTEAKKEAIAAKIDDFGYCNLDVVILYYVQMQMTFEKIEEIAKEVGLFVIDETNYLDTNYAVIYICKEVHRRCRTAMNEAFVKSLQKNGILCRVRYKID